MPGKEQIELIKTFETSRAPNPIFCHQEFLEKLAGHGNDPIGRRAVFLMQRLAIDARRLHYKATRGVNRGWRRSRLGGNQGSHFYAWWAPQNALPLEQSDGFSAAPEGALFLRDIRHHDDHSPLASHSLETHYLPVTVNDIRREEYGPSPWTQPQVRFASARQPVRMLKGHPGSGKTTALWHAADSSGAARVLYVTYSRDLATLARDYFDRYCSSHKRFDVVTFPNLIRQILRLTTTVAAGRDSRQRFLHDLAPFSRNLGAWTNCQPALYDEFHAHLVGDALPATIGRFSASKRPRVSDESYRERRTRFLGPKAATSALETAARLERLDPATLADRYFPELGLAWRAVERLGASATGRAGAAVDPELLDFDCIAVDECQDLTPIEAFVLVALASVMNVRRRTPVSLLLAGDEAQTVRPTDFEWGWFSDLLHAQVGTPSEYKLGANLRSPRRIAELVNRVWDLYSQIQKQERPSGTGHAEIDDDATDQILYCTAVPGPELDGLLSCLAAREGLAMIVLDESVPAFVPESVRHAVVTVSEAKGLDFHSVCVIDAGRQVERIKREDERLRAASDLESLRKRLAIDQLRVALSRPTERLLWLDINPNDRVVRESIDFLNGGNLDGGISSSVPAAVVKTFEEDELDAEERVQRCQADARQYLEIKPEMAWSRAQQAVTLLGRPGALAAVTDEAARAATYLTLAEICFTLGFRDVRLASELGRPDLFGEAVRAASNADRYGLATTLKAVEQVHHASAGTPHLQALAALAQVLPRYKSEIEPWLLLELQTKTREWIEELEAAMVGGHNAGVLINVLPAFYEALNVPDRTARVQRLQQRAIQLLIKEKQFTQALTVLRTLPERQPKLEAGCLEGLGDFRSAAESYREAGDLKQALNCYRSVPDLAAALALVRELGENPAGPSLEWMAKLQALVRERPEKFTKMATAAEKKFLEDLLEQALGVTRRKRAPAKAPRDKAAGPRRRTTTQAKPGTNPYR